MCLPMCSALLCFAPPCSVLSRFLAACCDQHVPVHEGEAGEAVVDLVRAGKELGKNLDLATWYVAWDG